MFSVWLFQLASAISRSVERCRAGPERSQPADQGEGEDRHLRPHGRREVLHPQRAAAHCGRRIGLCQGEAMALKDMEDWEVKILNMRHGWKMGIL